MSKTVIKTGNINSFTDNEQTVSDTSEIIVPKRQFYDRLKHTKFILDTYKKEVIQYKTEKETLNLQLKQLESVADKQLSIRKDLERQNKIMNDELMMLKNKHQTKCNDADIFKTEDINLINKNIEEEVRRNLEKNKIKILDPYLESLNKKYELL